MSWAPAECTELPGAVSAATVVLIGVVVMTAANHSEDSDTPSRRTDGTWCYPVHGPSFGFTGELTRGPPP